MARAHIVPAPVTIERRYLLADGEDFIYYAVGLAISLPLLAGLGALVVLAWRLALSADPAHALVG